MASREFSFLVQHNTQFGENVFLVGDLDEVGKWDVNRGRRMEWSGPHGQWKTTVQLPVGTTLKYKYVVRDDTNPGKVVWEDGQDREVALQAATSTRRPLFADEWGVTASPMAVSCASPPMSPLEHNAARNAEYKEFVKRQSSKDLHQFTL